MTINITEHNLKRPRLPGHPYRLLVGGGSEPEKTNALYLI